MNLGSLRISPLQKEKVIIDSSAILKWFFENEKENNLITLKARQAHLNFEIELCAPELIYYEVINSLILKINDEANFSKCFDSFLLSNIYVFNQTRESLKRIAEISRKHNITFYDASYLQLSIEMGCPLLSYDNKLLQAAKSESVKIFV